MGLPAHEAMLGVAAENVTSRARRAHCILTDVERISLERLSTIFAVEPVFLLAIWRVYVAFAANNDLCFSFLRRCTDYSEKMFA
jgi:hypothetical protein